MFIHLPEVASMDAVVPNCQRAELVLKEGEEMGAGVQQQRHLSVDQFGDLAGHDETVLPTEHRGGSQRDDSPCTTTPHSTSAMLCY